MTTTHLARASAQAATMKWTPPGKTSPKTVSNIVCSFLDAASTAFGRATHYNSETEQQAAEFKSHDELLALDRDLYATLLMLPGLTHRARQLGSRNLLSRPRNGHTGFLDSGIEREILFRLIQDLPAPKMFKLFEAFRVGAEDQGIKKANNARTRKLILRSILDSSKLELWAVKYRKKLASALTHAWGQKKTSFIRGALSKDASKRTSAEIDTLRREIAAYLDRGSDDLRKLKVRVEKVFECVGFVLGVRENLSLPLFKAFLAAKTDLKAGERLPPEVLEGIRSVYHKEIPKDEILRLTADNLTTTQRKNVQRAAKEAGVEVRMDPRDYDAVELYIYAFELGMTDEIAKALVEKAKKAASGFPATYQTVGVVVDASRSMGGDKSQKLRPMAATLALRDMLQFTAKTHHTVYCGGSFKTQEHEDLKTLFGGLWRPEGDTALAEGLVQVLNHENMPDSVFVLSDGYENAPAGRFSEVVTLIREMGITVPIYHLNPVFAAEVKGVRNLHEEVPSMPAKSPGSVSVSFLRGMIEADPVRGINTLLRMALNPSAAQKELAQN